MATWAELEAYEARDAAAKETHDQVLGEISADITESLTAARLGLAGAILSVAEACSVAPEALEELRTDVDQRVDEVVGLIFKAAVKEVGKEEEAKSSAQYAGERAKARKLDEISEAQIAAAFRSRSTRPLAQEHIQRRPFGRV